MSLIGEFHGFADMADAIDRRLAKEALTAEDRAEIERKAQWYRTESRCALSAARSEARQEEDDGRWGDR